LGDLKIIFRSDECDNDTQGTLVLEKGFGRVSGAFGSGTVGDFCWFWSGLRISGCGMNWKQTGRRRRRFGARKYYGRVAPRSRGKWSSGWVKSIRDKNSNHE
jgi:hypothetical protein